MSDPTPGPKAKTKLVIRNIGQILSGRIEEPLIDGDCVVCEGDRIVAVGNAKDLDTDRATTVVDARGVTLCPGLIDSHVHPVIGDYTPRQQQLNWIDSCLHGGVTTMISAGEVHAPGRPKDIVGLKAMAIASQRWYENFRPSGVKVHSGAPVLEEGMVESDFKDLADAGVKLLGEVGLGSVKAGETAGQMVKWARKYGIQSTIHTGGPSIPGSGLIDKDVVLEADADIIGHINGGHTALPDDQITCLCESCLRGIEIVHNGNERAGSARDADGIRTQTARTRHPRHRRAGRVRRPAARHPAHGGDAVVPRRRAARDRLLLRHRQHRADARPRLRHYRGRKIRRFRPYRHGAARTGQGSMLGSVHQGNLPGVGMTIIDGIVRTARSRNTPPATRLPEIVEG